MKKIFLLLLILPMFSFAQQKAKFWVSFTDKNNSIYTTSNPSAFLSARAINRRLKAGISVAFEDLPVNASYMDSVRNRGAKILNASKWLNGVSIELSDSTQIASIQILPFVKHTTAVAFRKSNLVHQDKFSNEFSLPDKNTQTPLQKTSGYNYGLSGAQINQLNGIGLHDKGFHGEGVIIALLDAGFYKVDSLPAFDSLRANNQILGVKDFVAGDNSVYEDHWHGMMVLSTIAGNIPGSIVGTAPKAQFFLLRTEDDNSEYIIEEYNWVCGAEYADSAGADVISSSLGYTVFNESSQNHTYASMDGNTCPSTRGADFAAARGMLVFVSAGNEGGSSWQYISAPSDGDSVVSVGAVNPFGTRAFFSSVGPSYDRRIKPNLAATGETSVVASTTGGVQFANGTSFACPILAGMSSCLLQAHPNLKNMEIIQALQQSGNQSMSPDSLLGYGIPDFGFAHDVLLGMTENSFGQLGITAFPNPFTGKTNIRIQNNDREGEMAIEIFDIYGRKLYAETLISKGKHLIDFEINESVLPLPGMYLLKANGKKFTGFAKIIKQ